MLLFAALSSRRLYATWNAIQLFVALGMKFQPPAAERKIACYTKIRMALQKHFLH